MGCDVKRHIDHVTKLYVELTDTVSAKHIKHHLLGILLDCLDDIRLRFPLSSCRHTASFWQNGNNLSL